MSLSEADAEAAAASTRDVEASLIAAGAPEAALEAYRKVKDIGVKFVENSDVEGKSPFVEAFTPDDANNQIKAMAENFKHKHVKDAWIFVRNVHGRNERIELSAETAQKYFSAPIETRRAFESAKLTEMRLTRALEAAKNVAIAEDGKIDRATLNVPREAALRESKAIVDYGDSMYVLKNFIREAERELAALREHTELEDYPVGYDSGRENLQYQTGAQTMYVSDIMDEQAKCAYAYSHDPVAKACVDIIVKFALGRRVPVKAKNDKVQAVLDEFLSRIRFHPRLKAWARSAGRDGELFLHVYPIGKGRSGVTMLEARSIWEICTLAEDVTVAISYIQRYMTRPQMFAPSESMRYISREYMADEIVHLKLNATDSEVRGRSDMYASLPWHKLFRDYWYAAVTKEKALASYRVFLSVDGSATDVAAIAASIPKREPKPGEVFVANKKVDVKVAQPTGQTSSGQGSIFEGLLSVIAMGYGFSKIYLGADGNRTRAGASVQAEPSEKTMDDRQDDLGDMLDALFRKVIDNAVAGGLLDGVKDEELYAWRIQFPKITESDTQQVLNNLETGRANGWISSRDAAPIWASEMDIDDYSFDEQQQLIAEEAEQGIFLPPIANAATGLPNPEDAHDDPASDGIPDPTSNDGKQQIRKQDRQALAPRMSMEDAAAFIVANGGIVIREA